MIGLMTVSCYMHSIDSRRRASVIFAIKAQYRTTVTVVYIVHCTMSGLRATMLVTIAALGCSVLVGPVDGTTAATGGRRYGGGSARLWSPTDWFRATVDGCGTAGWPQCVANKVARTLRLLEDADDLQITDGVRLVKTDKETTTTDRSAR